MTFLAGFCFGASVALAWALVRMTRRKTVAPTMHNRRQWREAPVEVVPKWQSETVGPSVRYEHLGMTGEEA